MNHSQTFRNIISLKHKQGKCPCIGRICVHPFIWQWFLRIFKYICCYQLSDWNKLENAKNERRKSVSTRASIRSASRILSLLITNPSFEVGVEIGVRDEGGLGGGKGWSNGVPRGRWAFKGERRATAVGVGDKRGGITKEGEEEGGAKKDGFTRLVTWLLLLIGSRVSWRIVGVKATERGADDICGDAARTGLTGTWEDDGMVADEW